MLNKGRTQHFADILKSCLIYRFYTLNRMKTFLPYFFI